MANEAERIQFILEAVDRLKGALTQTVTDLDKVTGAANKQNAATSALNKNLAGTDTLFRDLGIAAGVAAGAMALLVKNSIDSADAVSKQARALETTTEQLTQLNFAARLAVGGTDQLKVGLNQLGRALADSADSSSDTARLFKQLGIATKDAAGNLRGPVDVLFDVADAFNATEGAAAKASISQQLFGKGGKEFVDFLNQGSAAIREQGAELTALGGVFSGDTGQKAEDFNDNLTRLNETIKGIATTALPILLPPLLEVSNALVATLKSSNAAGEGATGLVTVFKTLAIVTVALVEGLRAIGVVVGTLLATSFEHLLILVNGVVQLFSVFGQNIGTLISSIGTLIQSLTGLGSVFGALKSGDFAGALAAGKTALAGIGDAGAKVAADFQKIFTDSGEVVASTTLKMADNLVSGVQTATSSIEAIADETKKLFDSLEADSQTFKKTVVEAGSAGGGAAGSKPQLQTLQPIKPIQDRSKAQEELNIKLRETQALIDTGQLSESQGIQRNAGLRQQAIAGIQAEKEALQSRLDAAEGFSQQQTAQIEQKIAQLSDLQTQLGQDTATEEFQSSAAGGALQFSNSLTGLQDTAKLTAGVLQSTVGTAIQGLSAGIIGLIKGTTTWGQIFTQVGLQILQSIINIGLQLLAQAVISAIATESVAAASSAAAVGVAGAWGAAAAAASIATYGSALAFGPLAATTIATTAALSASTSAAFAAFADGGLVPGTPSSTDNRLARVATGEYIFDSASVKSVGPAFMANLHGAIQSGRLGQFFAGGVRTGGSVPHVRSWGYAAGGLVGEAPEPPNTANTTALNIAFVHTRQQQRRFQQAEGVNITIDALDARNNPVVS